MIEIAIQEIANYDLKNIQEQITLNINGDKYLLNPTLNGGQYILTLVDTIEQPKVPVFGIAKGQIKMSDDFDEPLECFKDYMPDDEFFVKIKDKFSFDDKFEYKEINAG